MLYKLYLMIFAPFLKIFNASFFFETKLRILFVVHTFVTVLGVLLLIPTSNLIIKYCHSADLKQQSKNFSKEDNVGEKHVNYCIKYIGELTIFQIANLHSDQEATFVFGTIVLLLTQ